MSEKIVDRVIKQERLIRAAGKKPNAVVLSWNGHLRLRKEAEPQYAAIESNTIWGLPYTVDTEQEEDVRVLWDG